MLKYCKNGLQVALVISFAFTVVQRVTDVLSGPGQCKQQTRPDALTRNSPAFLFLIKPLLETPKLAVSQHEIKECQRTWKLLQFFWGGGVYD